MSGSKAKRPDDMTPDERSQFEPDVLAATQKAMEGGQSGFEYEFHDAALSGQYPNTTISVRYWDPRYQRESTSTYRIWKALVSDDGTLEHPAVRAAVLIKVWALGG
jgi:hypothetical protein